MLEWKKQNDFSEKQTITKETINHTETYIAVTPFGNLCISRSIIDLGNTKAVNLPYGFYFEGNLIDRSSLDYDSVMKLATDWYTERAEMIYNKLQNIKSQEAKSELESYDTIKNDINLNADSVEKNNKIFKKNEIDLLLGRPPIGSSILQQEFNRIVNEQNTSIQETNVIQPDGGAVIVNPKLV